MGNENVSLIARLSVGEKVLRELDGINVVEIVFFAIP